MLVFSLESMQGHRAQQQNKVQEEIQVWTIILESWGGRERGVGGCFLSPKSKTDPQLISCCWWSYADIMKNWTNLICVMEVTSFSSSCKRKEFQHILTIKITSLVGQSVALSPQQHKHTNKHSVLDFQWHKLGCNIEELGLGLWLLHFHFNKTDSWIRKGESHFPKNRVVESLQCFQRNQDTLEEKRTCRNVCRMSLNVCLLTLWSSGLWDIAAVCQPDAGGQESSGWRPCLCPAMSSTEDIKIYTL